ncbi:MAG: CinA family nicotinamide mononucleotide deamidase-related protein [Acidimicrobiia bacterium]|nr:CinA family nicotinamide mononucleotide deamidase-related protein [Acidimicrobiia bacterium]
MRAEVLAIGTELLLGQIVDTNSSWIGEQLALAGVDCLRHVRVGDNIGRMVEAIEEALGRADALIICGGLGPTQDDLTRDAITRVMGVGLVRDEVVAERIRAMFASRGRPMPENNLRQADVPAGAATIPQQPGTAPGLVCALGDKVMYAVPGVPYEMREMVAGTVIPDLQRRAGQPSVILSRTLRTWGQSESGLAELLALRIDELDVAGSPTLAFLASGIEGIKVRVTAKATEAGAARSMLDAEEAVLRGLLGELVFGLDEMTMEATVVDLLRKRGLTLALAESVTGGLMAARLSAVAGSEDVFLGAVTANSPRALALLGAPEGVAPLASAAAGLARAVCRTLGAGVGLASVGVLGPEASGGVAAGTVFIGLAIGDDVESVEVRLPGDRERVRGYGTISAFDLLRRRLLAALV